MGATITMGMSMLKFLRCGVPDLYDFHRKVKGLSRQGMIAIDANVVIFYLDDVEWVLPSITEFCHELHS